MADKWSKEENTPVCVKLDEDIALLVKDNLVELLANQVEHGLVLDFGDGLGLELRLELVV